MKTVEILCHAEPNSTKAVLDKQRQLCLEYAKKEANWLCSGQSNDEIISGYKSAKNRPALKLIQEKALAGKFDVLLVSDLKHLTLRRDEAVRIARFFAQQNVEIWSVNQGKVDVNSFIEIVQYLNHWNKSA